MKQIILIFLLSINSLSFGDVQNRGTSDFEDLSDEIAEMSDSEFAAYESRQRKENTKKEWAVFIVLIGVGFIYYIVSNRNKKQ